ncbi:MAG: hypothetical protein ABL949_04865 [Fimbriimonadaceae bacterium]
MRTFIGLAFAVTTASSFAITAVWAQPWNPVTKLPAWTSGVVSCANPLPARRMCFDDFRIATPTQISMISFWGTVSNPTQLNRVMRISIHTNNAATCRPNQAAIWSFCGVIPQKIGIGPDCQNRPVFRFNLPTGPALPVGQYWLCVAEDDSLSYRPNGIADFGWSAFQPMRFCPAIAYNSNATVNQPLIDPCNQQRDDLSFNLYKP